MVTDQTGTDMASPWPEFPPGSELRIVKLAPDGSWVTDYPGFVLACPAVSPWLALAARWVTGEIELDGLRFVPGDLLHEYFSPLDHFNVFAIFSPAGHLRGWYANVTRPATLDLSTAPPTLLWHDLYLDLIALPNGEIHLRDEDELAAANLAISDPALHATILGARDRMLARWRGRTYPFHDRDLRDCEGCPYTP